MENETLEALLAQGKEQLANQEAQLKQNVPTERTRAFFQGLTFGGADELEAWFKTVGDKDPEAYEEMLNTIRDNLDAYREARPIEAAGVEIAGALAPTIIATFATGGTALGAVGAKIASRFPRLAKALGGLFGTRATNTVVGGTAVGTAQGAAQGFGQGEGGFQERAFDAATGGVVGGALGAGGTIVGNVAAGTVDKIVDYARRQYGNRAAAAAQRELQRLAKERGISADEAAELIRNGSLLAENATLRDIMRTYRAAGGEAAELLRQGLTDRPKLTSKEATEYLERTLSGTTDGNVLQQQLDALGDMGDKARALYQGEMGKKFVPQSLLTEMSKVFKNAPEAFGAIRREMRTGDLEFPFRLEDGKVILEGDRLTIEQAEVVRRNLSNTAQKFSDAGEGGTANNIRAMEQKLRDLIDNISPETKQARATWSEMSNMDEAFQKASKGTVSKPNIDQMQIDWNTAIGQGDKAMNSFRLGVLSKLKQQLSGSTKQTAIKNMLDEDHPTGQLLREVFPEQNIPEMVRRLSVAKEANEAAKEILGGSPTAITEALIKREGASDDLLDIALSNGATFATAKLLMSMFRKVDPGLNDKQRSDLVMLMLSQDADMIANVIKTDNGYNLVEDRVRRFLKMSQAGGTRAEIERRDPERTINATFGMFGSGPQQELKNEN